MFFGLNSYFLLWTPKASAETETLLILKLAGFFGSSTTSSFSESEEELFYLEDFIRFN